MIARAALFDRRRCVHLVGAGGVGVSALGQALLHAGHGVSGSDMRESELTRKLTALGARIRVPHAPENLPLDADLVVITAAVDGSNPEVAAARDRGISVVKYAQALGDLMGQKTGVAVAGTHGKTTTTGLLTTVMVCGGLDPTMVLGGEAAPLGGNFRPGASPWFVAEACEFDRSFLSLRPRIALVTNVDRDHLDCYRDLEEIQEAFGQFAALLPADGYLTVLNEHERVFRGAATCDMETFGLRGNADWVASAWRREEGVTAFRVAYRGRDMGVFRLRMAGLHNVLNSLGVIAVAHRAGVCLDTHVRQALLEYRGVDRRMQVRYEGGGVVVLDDYAHHPSELAATLTALRDENPGRRIVAVFQPHQASRTRRLLRGFAEALKLADRVFVSDIYLARDSDSDRRSVHALDLVRTAANQGVDVSYVEHVEEVAERLLGEIRAGDLVVTLGAGSVGEVSRTLAARLKGFDDATIAPR